MSVPAGAGAGLRAKTLGHASLVIYREGERPLLLTDPWLVGSVYWRSWWLQHYPSVVQVGWLAQSRYVYVTHDHPDHFHMPSIRRLGAAPLYLLPALAETPCRDHLTALGYRAELLSPLTWLPLGDGISILSIPVWNDDSLLLVDTPDALILNLNDAKPPPPVLRAICRLGERVGKRRILLCSYSPASLVNSFLDGERIVSLRPASHYVDYICRLCDRLGADFYMPFASQAEFRRADSRWANDHRTTYADLCRYWHSPARLLAPYATLDLADFTWSAVPPEAYRPLAAERVGVLTEARAEAESKGRLSPSDLARLEAKLNKFRWLLRAAFPRGFGFRLGIRHLHYDPRRGRLSEQGETGQWGDFAIELPELVLAEAVRNNHVSDLGITMFVRIRLLCRLDPRRVYALFVLFQLDDYGHLRSPGALWRWLRRGLRYSFPGRLPAPLRARKPGSGLISRDGSRPRAARRVADN